MKIFKANFETFVNIREIIEIFKTSVQSDPQSSFFKPLFYLFRYHFPIKRKSTFPKRARLSKEICFGVCTETCSGAHFVYSYFSRKQLQVRKKLSYAFLWEIVLTTFCLFTILRNLAHFARY